MSNKRPPLWRSAVNWLLPLAAFLIIWHFAVRLAGIKPFVLPSPFDVLALGWEEGFLFDDIFASTIRVCVGFVLAVVVATPIGLVMGISRRFNQWFGPILSLIRPLPSMSWIPLSIIWFGLDEQQKYYIVFMGCFAPIVVSTMEAARQVDPAIRRAAKNLGASPAQELLFVVFPAVLPAILGGWKVVLAIAWTCVISAEMVGANSGLGFSILAGKDLGNTKLVFLGMLCISVTVLLLDGLFRGIEWLCLPYRRSTE